ncbi:MULTISPECIES: response regulator [unclassified Nostoc]|jgi:CheY-like chemotaxis protein|uniref:response regulator n=1 Tax=unclassified Nostoc TaxID=2593658 RepID=UPI000DEC8B6E|nr:MULTISPECIES: response regulator [unclassified Nostoc]MBD2508562.1 response regulator [Desmonostoc muscorum FACHB-395]QHG18461.1 response regulator [Nostoc sp. ATCC 53789]QLE51222.1 response regulator [Nostoc sp. C057]RCJ24895.1 histidine kinase [Nostoc sp. ATCC 53789]
MSNQSMSFKGLRLLVVDDDPDTRTLLTFLFELEGAEIITAASAGAAIEIMSFFKPDIFISDIYLPDENGCSLLMKVRNLEANRGRKIPAIALTASAFDEDQNRALLAGYDIYRCKPIDLDDLSSTVASLVTLEEYA